MSKSTKNLSNPSPVGHTHQENTLELLELMRNLSTEFLAASNDTVIDYIDTLATSPNILASERQAALKVLQSRIAHHLEQLDTVLPAKAPTLWSERTQTDISPVEFIRTHYEPYLGKGLTRAHIRQLDRLLYYGLNNFIKLYGMPEDLDLPTKKEMNDRLLRTTFSVLQQSDTGRERDRLRSAARRRSLLPKRSATQS